MDERRLDERRDVGSVRARQDDARRMSVRENGPPSPDPKHPAGRPCCRGRSPAGPPCRAAWASELHRATPKPKSSIPRTSVRKVEHDRHFNDRARRTAPPADSRGSIVGLARAHHRGSVGDRSPSRSVHRGDRHVLITYHAHSLHGSGNDKLCSARPAVDDGLKWIGHGHRDPLHTSGAAGMWTATRRVRERVAKFAATASLISACHQRTWPS